MKYLIHYSTKGGVGKSTISKIAHQVLADNNQKKVAGEDLDPQQHYADWMGKNASLVSSEESSDYFIYDTQGAHTKANEELLCAVKSVEAIVLIPVRPSIDDMKEAERIATRLKRIGIQNKCIFFFNGCIANCSYKDYREVLEGFGIKVARKQINTRKAFAEKPTLREINDISALLLEVLL